MSEPNGERHHDEAAQWVLRLADGTLPIEHELELQLWLQENEASRARLEQMVAVWDNAALAGGEPELIGIRADALDAMRTANQYRWSRRVANDWRAFTAVACVLLVAMMIGWTVFRTRPDLYATGTGEQRVVALADGSRIFLDADSRVEVAFSDERRSLQLLAGRAKFDVAKDPRRPFTVTAGGRMVVATGTSFSVELIRSSMQVVLYEGSVAVLDDGPSNAPPRHLSLVGTRQDADRLLKAGTMLVSNADQLTAVVRPIDLPRSLSWQKGQLAFSGEPLSEAVERVNRYSTDRLIVTDPRVAAIRISGVFDQGDTAGFVDGVTALYQLSASRSGNVVTLAHPSPTG